MNSDSSAKPSNKKSSCLLTVMNYAFALLSLSLVCGYAYFFIFARFQVYDDEGFFLISIKQFLEGHELYDVVYSIYQPFYYVFNWFWFSLIRCPVGHDAIRLQTIFLWVCCAVVNSLIILKITGSRLLGMFVLLLSALHLNGFANEPGHPQALSYLLTFGILLICVNADKIPAKHYALAVAVLAGMLLMTKINIGVYATLALVFVMSVHTENKYFRYFEILPALLITILPTALMLSLISDFSWTSGQILFAAILVSLIFTSLLSWRQQFSLSANLSLVVISLVILFFLRVQGTGLEFFYLWMILTLPCISAILHVKPCKNGKCFSINDWAWGTLSLFLTMFIFCLFLFLRGTSGYGLLQGIILFPLSQPSSFSVPFRFGLSSGILSLAGVGLSCAYLWNIKTNKYFNQIPRLIKYIKTVFGGLVILYFSLRSISMMPFDIPHFWMMPFIWIVLINDDGKIQNKDASRMALVIFAVIQTLIAYPIAGSQLVQAYATPLLIAAVCLHDGIVGIITEQKFHLALSKKIICGCTLAFLITIPWQYLVLRGARRYAALTSLGLPGASMIRLKSEQVEEFRQISAILAKPDVSTFISMPGMNSFYLWAEKDPPTGLNITTWMTLFNEKQQSEIWSAAIENPGLMILRNRHLVNFWVKDISIDHLPLVREINNQFLFADDNQYELINYQPEKLNK